MGQRPGPPLPVVDAVRMLARGLVSTSRRLAPQPVPLLDLISGHWRVHAIGQMARLGIADLLAAGPRDVADLARTTGTNEDALFRVLRALAAEGVFTRIGQQAFGLNAMAQPLRADHPMSVRHTIIQITSEWNQRAWLRLDVPLRDGRPAFPQVFGSDLWSWFSDHPQEGEHFDQSMRELSRLDVAPVLAAHDFTGYPLIADIGGGSGQLLAGILAATPGVRGVLYDVERATDDAPGVLASAEVADRVDIVNGSFYESVPGGCDAYVLRQVVHGLTDEAVAPVLANVRSAMSPSSRLLVLDTLVPEQGRDHPGSLDLQMLVGNGGRERTAREMADLFETNGLRLLDVVRTTSPTAVFIGAPEPARTTAVVEGRQPPTTVMRVVNPLTRLLIRRGLADADLGILHYVGRRSGKHYDTPAALHHVDGKHWVFTSSTWQHNFTDGVDIEVTIRSQRRPAHAVLVKDPPEVTDLYSRVIDAVGWRTAQGRLGIKIRARRTPTRREIHDAISDSTIAAIRLDLDLP